jgi:hypothetical protein
MGDRPGRTDGAGAADDPADGASIVTCSFQDGTLSVYDEWLHIERPDRSTFDDVAIELADVTGVTYRKRLVISYLQVDQAGVETDEASLLSTPVDENTLHFGRGKRDCARRARDAIRDGAGVW